MSNYTEIQNAFETKLALLTDLPLIIKENEQGTKNQDDENAVLQQPYIRTFMIPTRTEDLTIGISGWDQFQGIFQISIFTPYDNGIAESNYWVDEIINHFKQSESLVITGGLVRIKQRSRIVGTQSTNYHQTGVELIWYTHLQRA